MCSTPGVRQQVCWHLQLHACASRYSFLARTLVHLYLYLYKLNINALVRLYLFLFVHINIFGRSCVSVFTYSGSAGIWNSRQICHEHCFYSHKVPAHVGLIYFEAFLKCHNQKGGKCVRFQKQVHANGRCLSCLPLKVGVQH